MVLAPLRDLFKSLYINPRGTFPSSRPLDATEMTSQHMVEDLEVLRQYLKLDPMLLLGHTNGGSIALGYAPQYPSDVKKLVLLDHELQGSDHSVTYIEFAMKRKDGPMNRGALERLLTSKGTRMKRCRMH